MADQQQENAPAVLAASPEKVDNATAPEVVAQAPPAKPIHSLIVDTGPLIKNDPPISTLLAQAHEIYTLPSVLTEIRDAATRARVETTLLPFLKLRSPKPESIKFTTDFARRTGDLEVLSRPDLHLIALAYELECERNGGDWRLRKTPGQKTLNGKPPGRQDEAPKGEDETKTEPTATTTDQQNLEVKDSEGPKAEETLEATSEATTVTPAEEPSVESDMQQEPAQEAISDELQELSLQSKDTVAPPETAAQAETASPEVADEDDDDEDGWITPSNLKKHQAKDQQASPEQPIQRLLQVALLTSDYAMQNVILRMNLNLVSPNLARITRVKTWVLRCHGCFQITRDMTKQFCPRCGQPTLTRVSCSTDQSGNVTVHLKKNYQWNKRGNVYSVPKPVHGSSNGKMRGPGGGKNGWGRELILAEDQKEYTRQVDTERKARARDLMDEDYLPGILTGERGNGQKVRVGAGRSVNSKKRN